MTITFNLADHLNSDEAFRALYNSLRAFNEKSRAEHIPGLMNFPLMESYCLLEALREQHPEAYDEAEAEYEEISFQFNEN